MRLLKLPAIVASALRQCRAAELASGLSGMDAMCMRLLAYAVLPEPQLERQTLCWLRLCAALNADGVSAQLALWQAAQVLSMDHWPLQCCQRPSCLFCQWQMFCLLSWRSAPTLTMVHRPYGPSASILCMSMTIVASSNFCTSRSARYGPRLVQPKLPGSERTCSGAAVLVRLTVPTDAKVMVPVTGARQMICTQLAPVEGRGLKAARV